MQAHFKRIYLSGPVTGTNDAPERFAAAEMELRKKFTGEFEIINPVEICRMLPESFNHGEYMTVCLALLTTCDAICMLPGWKESIGARVEYRTALRDDNMDLDDMYFLKDIYLLSEKED